MTAGLVDVDIRVSFVCFVFACVDEMEL